MSTRSQLLAALRRLRFTAPELADLLDLPRVDDLGRSSSASGWASSGAWARSRRSATNARGPAS